MKRKEIAPDESKSSFIILGIAVLALIGAVLALMFMFEVDERTRPVGQPKPTPPPINNAEFQYGVDPLDPIFMVEEGLCAKAGNECEEEAQQSYEVIRDKIIKDFVTDEPLTQEDVEQIAKAGWRSWVPKKIVYSTVEWHPRTAAPLPSLEPLPTPNPSPTPPKFVSCEYNPNDEGCEEYDSEPCEHTDSCVNPYEPPVAVSAPGSPLAFIAMGAVAVVALRKVKESVKC